MAQRPPRQRVPLPLIKSRIASGAPSMLQPNATGDGGARLTGRFWLFVVVTGVAAGLLGALTMAVLFSVEHLAYGVGWDGIGFTHAVAHTSPWRRVVTLLAAGAFGGVAWYLLRRHTRGKKSEVDEVLWTGEGRLSTGRSFGTAAISEVVIGLGASIGREAAPKLLGAVAGTVFGGWGRLTAPQVRLLVACGAGAGLAAVYNVPLGGALFTAEVLIGSMNLPVILPALLCTGVATLVSWVYLPEHATYLGIPDYPFSSRLLVWAIVAGPVIGVLAAGFVRMVAWLSHHRAKGKALLVAPLLAFGLLAIAGLGYPQLYGNGKGMAAQAFLGIGTLATFAALSVLKPVLTSLCLGAGAAGGLFTPTMSTGAVLGAFLGLAWSQLWPGSPVGAYALIGAAAMIGAGMQAPLAALALVLELTHSGFAIMMPMVVATVLATAVTRWIDGYSIYSARLSAPIELDVLDTPVTRSARDRSSRGPHPRSRRRPPRPVPGRPA